MSVTSPAFEHNTKIPSNYTCDGEDINPPLEFVNVPEEAQSLVLIVEDPDSVGKTWTHWVVFNISPQLIKLEEDTVPRGAVETVTDFGNKGYGGPCPANGIHRYNFKLLALDTILDYTEDITRDELLEGIEKNIIETAELTGLYSRE